MLDAEGADDNVGNLADGDAQVSQLAVVPGGARGEVSVQHRHKDILAQPVFNARGMGLVRSTLEDFQQDQVTDREWFPRSRGSGGDARIQNGRWISEVLLLNICDRFLQIAFLMPPGPSKCPPGAEPAPDSHRIAISWRDASAMPELDIGVGPTQIRLYVNDVQQRRRPEK